MITGFYNILEADNLSTEYIFFITEVVRYKNYRLSLNRYILGALYKKMW